MQCIVRLMAGDVRTERFDAMAITSEIGRVCGPMSDDVMLDDLLASVCVKFHRIALSASVHPNVRSCLSVGHALLVDLN